MTDGRGTNAIVGPVYRPGDTRYDEACAIYNRLYRARPALVIRPVDGHDVARALAYAQREGYEVAVRGGGHSLAAFGTTEGGLLIDLADLDEIAVDAQTRTATAGGGVRAGAFTAATYDQGSTRSPRVACACRSGTIGGCARRGRSSRSREPEAVAQVEPAIA